MQKLSFLLIPATIFLVTLTWAIIQGPPYVNVINFEVLYSLDIIIIRLPCIISILALPAAVFFYFAIRIRNDDKPKSIISFWLGMGIVFFAIAFIVSPIVFEFRFFQVFILPAPIIFYLCFSIPDWFKRKIGWPD